MTCKKGFVVGVLVLLVYCAVIFRVVSARDDGCVGEKCKDLASDNLQKRKIIDTNTILSSNKNSSSHSSNNKDEGDEFTFHTPSPALQPKALNMLAEGVEDPTEMHFQPTPLSTINTASTKNTNSSLSIISSTTHKTTTENNRGRALNFTLQEKPIGNNLANHSSKSQGDELDLSDVTIEDDEDDIPSDVMIVPKILTGKNGDIEAEPEEEKKSNHLQNRNDTFVHGFCEQGGLTYENGEKLEHGCDTICTCNQGKMNCVDRCTGPFFKRGKKLTDQFCTAKDTNDPCCSVMVCAEDTETEPIEMCIYQNKTYQKGETFNKNCSELCTCNVGGNVSCKSRCPPTKKSSDRCVEVPDPNDHCCKQVLCDVTLDDHQDPEKEDGMMKTKYKLISATQVNDSVVALNTEPKFDKKEAIENLPIAELSNDKSDWTYYQTLPGGLVFVREPLKYLRLEGSDDVIEITSATKKENRKEKEAINQSDKSKSCKYKGKKFTEGENFNDDCQHLCICEKGEMKCLKLECPTYFGADVMDPNCIEWETIPPNFKASPPNCCPEKIKCKNNGSCSYMRMSFRNWEKIPANLTGCEKTCYCEMGHVECQNNCPPVPALPPTNLPCAPHDAFLQTAPHDECCKSWECKVDHISSASTINPLDKKTKNANNTDANIFLGPFTPLTTTDETENLRIFGPLTIYENGVVSINKSKPLYSLQKPQLSKAENPFYRKSPQKTHHTSSNSTVHKIHKFVPKNIINKSDIKKPVVSRPHMYKPTSHRNTGFLPPLVLNPDKLKMFENDNIENISKISDVFNTKELTTISNNNINNYGQTSSLPKTNKGNIQNSEKVNDLSSKFIDHNIFTSSIHSLEPILPSNKQTSYPNIYNHPGIENTPLQDHHITINGKGSPEDLLKFIQNNPELSKLPSGSVLEFKSTPLTIPASVHQAHYSTPSISGNDPLSQIEQTLISSNKIPGQQPYFGPHIHVVPEEYLHQILNNLQGNRHLQDQIVADSNKGQVLTTLGQKETTDKINVTITDFNNHFPDDFGDTYHHQLHDEIEINTLEAIDAHTIKLAFAVPRIYVGLHGRVEVRYTHKKSTDVESWESQIFAPPNDLIETPSLEFDLHDLLPDKEYKVKISISLRDLNNSPSSRVYKIKTPKEPESSTLPPRVPIEPDMEISDINSTWVTVVWRKFKEYELQFIDGVQLRYKEVDGKIYAATPLIHRAVTTFTVENLKPNVKYEIGIFFIPFPNQKTELHAERMLHFTTANEVDNYGFSVILEISQIKATSVEISWTGVPYPEDKYVNIYRAIYQSDSGKEDQSTFKVAKRDSSTKTIIMDIKPGTRYRLWLEVYLTNGKIKTSNVQDFITKPRIGPLLGSEHDKLSRAEMVEATRGDYYGPLVIVAILASIAILSTLILLLILVRRHNQNKAAITPPGSTRMSNGAYDNPTYKVEIQQETMGL